MDIVSEARGVRLALRSSVQHAYRYARGIPVDRDTAERGLNRVGVYAMRLVDIAWADERDLWDDLVRELREPNLYQAAALLAQLGYDVSASALARVWECQCGDRLNSRAAFEEHEAAPVHTIASSSWECRCGLAFIEPSWLEAHQSEYASSINDHRARVHR